MTSDNGSPGDHSTQADEASPASDKATILVVEDEPDLLHLLVHNLGRFEGWRVVTATSRAAAERALESVPVNLVILDIMLPDGSGLKLCHKIRTTAHTSQIPVVVVTASLLPSNREEGFAAGASDYITKPFAISELIGVVKKHLADPGGLVGEQDSSQLALLPELRRGEV